MAEQRNSQNNAGYYGLFNDSFPPILDGVTLTVDNYARWLDTKGMKPCIVTPWNPLRFPSDYHTLKYFSLPIRTRKPYRYGYPFADPAIWLRLMSTPIKIAHAHCPFSSGRLAKFAARYHDVPLIGTFHSKYRDDLHHSFTQLPWMTDLIMARILDFFNSCDHVWIPQADVERTVREYGYKGELTVVENGNDFADIIKGDVAEYKRAARRKLNIQENSLCCLFVGQHIWEKGTGTIIKALDAIKDCVDFDMHFVGQGYAAADLKKMAVDAGISNRVTFHGIVNGREQISDFYAAADLFLFPSPYDNAPLVVREAAAMGTPSILLKGSTAAEVISDTENGFLTENSPENFAATLKWLANNRGEISTAAAGARKTLVRSWQDVVDEVALRYKDIIRTHQNIRSNGKRL